MSVYHSCFMVMHCFLFTVQARKVVEDHNVVGEGRIMGGLMVVGKGDEVRATTPPSL
jgi:hypothetical protein